MKKITLCAALLLGAAVAFGQNIDSISFGVAASEQSHRLAGDRSEIFTGAPGEPARRLLPPATENWEGGRVSFALAVEPAKQNYFTAKFFGGEANPNRLILFCEGKQIGYRHLGDIDILDFGSEGEPGFNGRFYYNTTPLPVGLTHGKTNLNFEIRSTGPTWSYANNFEQYQKPMTSPARGIYKIYTHTDGFFVPPPDEKQGEVPANPPVRQTPGAEILDQLKARVDDEIKNLLASARPLNEMQAQFLAKAYFVKWTPAFQNPKVVTQVVKGLDALFAAYRENPELAHHDPATPNPDWFEFGPAGDAIQLLSEQIKPLLEDQIDDSGRKISRRAAYSEMFVASRDWHRRHRRLYSNQTMINDLFGIYLNNRAIEIVDPANALSEKDVRRYLYESVGLEPWRDSDPGGEPAIETYGHGWNAGTNYFEITGKGLTRELGYVGYYGEVLDWVTFIYDATRPAPGQPGDEKIKSQLEKFIHARANFRYPMLDTDGNRAMRIETIVGWRDMHYPGNVTYGERPTWDASTLCAAAATLDPQAIGCAQQMFDDNQFFASVRQQMSQNDSLRVTAGLLGVPEQYELLKSQPPGAYRLPMSPGQPDFVFSDEDDGVVAIKNGDEIFYASLYWRARNAVNFLARVHFITPRVDRIAVVREETEFEPSGQFYTRPDWINFGFGGGGPRYPVEMHLAEAGEKLPIAKIPDGVKFEPGDESVYAGKGEFYTLRYGDYLIGMNLTADKTFELKTPPEISEAKELVSGKPVKLDAPLKVPPRSTLVLWFGK